MYWYFNFSMCSGLSFQLFFYDFLFLVVLPFLPYLLPLLFRLASSGLVLQQWWQAQDNNHTAVFLCCSLQIGLLHEAKEVRAAVLRVLRHLLQAEDMLSSFLALHMDYLVMRSCDLKWYSLSVSGYLCDSPLCFACIVFSVISSGTLYVRVSACKDNS